ncbi:MAG: hypothetical protein ISS71_02640 [Phycisphaerae bacterium]|nr:hypothetical protein [Phycisphaerae bacterium]
MDKLFWKVLPFICVAVLAFFILLNTEGIENSWPIFMIFLSVFLFGAALPVFAEMTNALHIHLLQKKVAYGYFNAIPELEKAKAKSGKWARVFIITWITGVIIGLGFMLYTILIKSHVPWHSQPTCLSPGSSTYFTLTLLTWIFYISGLLGILFMLSMGILFLKALFSRKNRSAKKFPRALIFAFIFFFASFANIFFSDYLTSRIIRHKVVPFLHSASADARVYINSKPVADPNRFIAVLSEVKPYPAHHSHALDTFEVRIESNEQTLTLQLGRDSSYENEYWVFFPGFRSSPPKIGRVTTNIFDDLP